MHSTHSPLPRAGAAVGDDVHDNRSPTVSLPTHTPSPVRTSRGSSMSSGGAAAETTPLRTGTFTVTANSTRATSNTTTTTTTPAAATTPRPHTASSLTSTHTLNPAAKEFRLPDHSSSGGVNMAAAAAAAGLYTLPLSDAATSIGSGGVAAATALNPYIAAGLTAAGGGGGHGGLMLATHPGLLATTPQQQLQLQQLLLLQQQQQQAALCLPNAALFPYFVTPADAAAAAAAAGMTATTMQQAAANTTAAAATPLSAPTMASHFTSTWSSALGHSAATAAHGLTTPMTAPALPSAHNNNNGSAAATAAAAGDDAVMQAQYMEYIYDTYIRHASTTGDAAAGAAGNNSSNSSNTRPQWHIVAVFRLNANTTSAQLASLFFPMGASDATVLEPCYLPMHLRQHRQLAHQRVGVVFFVSRECAMMGVEKMGDFKAKGQHNKLVVRYCGPDVGAAHDGTTATATTTTATTATATTSSPAPPATMTTMMTMGGGLSSAAGRNKALPWMLPFDELASVHEAMYATHHRDTNATPTTALVAVHGLDEHAADDVLQRMASRTAAMGFEVWRPSSTSRGVQLGASASSSSAAAVAALRRCMSVSAVLVFHSDGDAQAAVALFDHTTPYGQRWPVRLLHLTAATITPTHTTTTTTATNTATSTPLHSGTDTSALATLATSPLTPAGAAFAMNSSSNSSTTTTTTTNNNNSHSNRSVVPSSPAQLPATTTTTVTTAQDALGVYDDIDRHYLAKYAHTSYHLVGVHNLRAQTDRADLFSIFNPHCARDAEVAERAVAVGGRLCRSGVALFDTAGMAQEAARKVNNFVPLKQSYPLLVRYLHRAQPAAETTTTTTASAARAVTATPRTDGCGASTPRMRDEHDGQQQQQQQPPHTTRTACGSGATTTLTQLLHDIEREMREADVQRGRLTTAMVRYVRHAMVMLQRVERRQQKQQQQQQQQQATTASATPVPHKGDKRGGATASADDGDAASTTAPQQQLATLLVSVLCGLRHHAMAVASPLSGALSDLHSALQLRRRSFNEARDAAAVNDDNDNNDKASNDDDDDDDDDKADAAGGGSEARRESFALCIAKEMLCLVIDHAAPREARLVAAVLCAYAFQFRYMRGSPDAFAAAVLRSHADRLRAAKAFLAREADMVAPGGAAAAHNNMDAVDAATAQQHRACKTLVDALSEMTSTWRRHNRTRAKRDPDARAVDDIIHEFYGRPTTATSAVAAGSGAGATSTPLRAAAVDGAAVASDDASAYGANSSARRTAASSASAAAVLVTPSARPTPRRVITRVSSSSLAVGKGGIGTPVANMTAAAAATPLSGASPAMALASPLSDQTQGVSADASLDTTNASPRNTTAAAAAMPYVRGTATTTTSALTMTSAADGHDRTVYVTKLPACLSAGKLRRLLLHFGDIAKVRVCCDDKDASVASTSSRSAHSSYAAAANNSSSSHDGGGGAVCSKLCHGFVEFVDAAAARAMIEYFRNAVHMAGAFDFLRSHDAATAHASQPQQHNNNNNDDDGTAALQRFSEDELQLLRGTRASQARKRIHDHKPLDAVFVDDGDSGGSNNNATAAVDSGAATTLRCAQACQFGLVLPHVAIDAYKDACGRVLRATSSPHTSSHHNSSYASNHAASSGGGGAGSRHHSTDARSTSTRQPQERQMQQPQQTQLAMAAATDAASRTAGDDDDDDDDGGVTLFAFGRGLFGGAFGNVRGDDDAQPQQQPQAQNNTQATGNDATGVDYAALAHTLTQLQEQRRRHEQQTTTTTHADPDVLAWDVAAFAIDDDDDDNGERDRTPLQQTLLTRHDLW